MKLKYAIKRVTNEDGNVIEFIEHRTMDVDQIRFCTNSDMTNLFRLKCIKYGALFNHKETLELGQNVLYLKIDSDVFLDNISKMKQLNNSTETPI